MRKNIVRKSEDWTRAERAATADAESIVLSAQLHQVCQMKKGFFSFLNSEEIEFRGPKHFSKPYDRF
jgi:hypothetical protein